MASVSVSGTSHLGAESEARGDAGLRLTGPAKQINHSMVNKRKSSSEMVFGDSFESGSEARNPVHIACFSAALEISGVDQVDSGFETFIWEPDRLPPED